MSVEPKISTSVSLFYPFSYRNVYDSYALNSQQYQWHASLAQWMRWNPIIYFIQSIPRWKKEFYISLPVADPGFSWGGGANSQVGIILQIYLPKTAWKWKNLDPQIQATELVKLLYQLSVMNTLRHESWRFLRLKPQLN